MREPIDQWLDSAEWLARELPEAGVRKNVLGDAYAFLTQTHAGNFMQWLTRYASLDADLFRTGNTSAQQRKAFARVCRQLRPQPDSIRAWGYIIGWTQRMYPETVRRLPNEYTESRSNTGKPPRKPKRPKKGLDTRKPKAAEPEVRENTSKLADDIFKFLQSKKD